MAAFDTNQVIPMDAFKEKTADSDADPRPSRIWGLPVGPVAVLMLLIASACWGFSYTWAKAGMDAMQTEAGFLQAIQRADPAVSNLEQARGLAQIASPFLTASWRFLVTAFLWLLIFPRSLKGWTARSVKMGLAIGSAFGIGVYLQFFGLLYTTPIVNAFLIGLFIFFVPLIETIVKRKLPRWPLLVGGAVAITGVFLLTVMDHSETMQSWMQGNIQIGRGELFTIGAAFCYSITIVLLSTAMQPGKDGSPGECPYRMGFASMLFGGIFGIPLTYYFLGPSILDPFTHFAYLSNPTVWHNLVVSILFSGLVAFILQFRFQQYLSPTRASLIYSTEQIFAMGYATVYATMYATGYEIHRYGYLGAILIVAANLFVILVPAESRPPSQSSSSLPPAP